MYFFIKPDTNKFKLLRGVLASVTHLPKFPECFPLYESYATFLVHIMCYMTNIM